MRKGSDSPLPNWKASFLSPERVYRDSSLGIRSRESASPRTLSRKRKSGCRLVQSFRILPQTCLRIGRITQPSLERKLTLASLARFGYARFRALLPLFSIWRFLEPKHHTYGSSGTVSHRRNILSRRARRGQFNPSGLQYFDAINIWAAYNLAPGTPLSQPAWCVKTAFYNIRRL